MPRPDSYRRKTARTDLQKKSDAARSALSRFHAADERFVETSRHSARELREASTALERATRDLLEATHEHLAATEPQPRGRAAVTWSDVHASARQAGTERDPEAATGTERDLCYCGQMALPDRSVCVDCDR